MTMSIVNIPSLLPSYIINRPSPSARDGISIEVEKYQRIYGCELIQQSGIILNLNQVVMVTAQNILNRFYYRLSPSSMFYIYFDYYIYVCVYNNSYIHVFMRLDLCVFEIRYSLFLFICIDDYVE